MGKQPMATNCGREREGSESGPLSKASDRILKLASQAMKKQLMPPRCMEWSWRGRTKKRHTTGMNAKSLIRPLGKILVAALQYNRDAITETHTLMKLLISHSKV